MKRIVAAAIGLLALAASHAGLGCRSSPQHAYKAPAYVPAGYNWTGFYLGINAGGGFGNSDWNGFPISNSPSGGMIGGTAGYNWQGMGNPWVFGLEGDIDWTNVNDSTICGGLICQTKNSWFGTLRGRAGYSCDRFLPYLTGGVAFGDIQANARRFVGVERQQCGLDARRRHRRRHRRSAGPRRSNISTPTLARPLAPARPAAWRPTSTSPSTWCAAASTTGSNRPALLTRTLQDKLEAPNLGSGLQFLIVRMRLAILNCCLCLDAIAASGPTVTIVPAPKSKPRPRAV